MFIEILFKMLLFKGDVLIYAEHCISNEDLEAVLASLRSSTTESKSVSVECPLLKPDWLLSRRLFCVRKAVTWLNTTHSSVFAMKGRRETGL